MSYTNKSQIYCGRKLRGFCCDQLENYARGVGVINIMEYEEAVSKCYDVLQTVEL